MSSLGAWFIEAFQQIANKGSLWTDVTLCCFALSFRPKDVEAEIFVGFDKGFFTDHQTCWMSVLSFFGSLEKSMIMADGALGILCFVQTGIALELFIITFRGIAIPVCDLLTTFAGNQLKTCHSGYAYIWVRKEWRRSRPNIYPSVWPWSPSSKYW